ncbi:hypothetical protein AA0488_2211 [Kozakia baliensis NRIC 0488]|nr:hypothetical protein AA0488_2211 [Kozakia baliensis NRIC 0488]
MIMAAGITAMMAAGAAADGGLAIRSGPIMAVADGATARPGAADGVAIRGVSGGQGACRPSLVDADRAVSTAADPVVAFTEAAALAVADRVVDLEAAASMEAATAEDRAAVTNFRSGRGRSDQAAPPPAR